MAGATAGTVAAKREIVGIVMCLADGGEVVGVFVVVATGGAD